MLLLELRKPEINIPASDKEKNASVNPRVSIHSTPGISVHGIGSERSVSVH
jgi:hypothetical protein